MEAGKLGEERLTTDSRQPMALAPRDRHEAHRVSTQLELLFDLAYVIAIGAAAAGLHHAISAGHVAQGVVGYAMAFFAIWWAWMNYTWFASAYDDGSTGFRLVTMGIMFGALLMAAGIPGLSEAAPSLQPLAGYLVMRFGLVALWLMAAGGDPARRATCLRYAAGVSLVQVYWVLAFVAVGTHGPCFAWAFAVGAIAELSVPVLAERAGQTVWHRHHIIERYALLNIIVLGEGLLSVVIALRAGGEGAWYSAPSLGVALAAAVTSFALWWIYFADEETLASDENRHAFVWGYGHVLVFAAGAAVGPGFEAIVDLAGNHAHVSLRAGVMAIAVPVAVYVLAVWFVRDRRILPPAGRWVLPVGALAVLVAGAAPPPAYAVGAVALAAAATAAARTIYGRRRSA